jgi:hypothetical protein
MDSTPTPTPMPVVVDAVSRDWVDWITFGVGIAGALIGATAIVYAVLAYQHAKDAEASTRRTIAKERKTVFELELLRDLIEIIEKKSTYIGYDFQEETALWSRLPFFPDELPFWHFMRDQSGDPDSPVIRERLDADGVPASGRYMIAGQLPALYWRIHWRFRKDVTEAIERRTNDNL